MDNVYLVGIEVEHCPKCGDSPIIPTIGRLHDAIASSILKKPGRLSGKEIRFLRMLLGWSAADLAGRVGVTPSQMSRWENDREKVGTVADRLVRSIYALDGKVPGYTSEAFALLSESAKPRKVRLAHAGAKGAGSWTEQASV